jgi:Bacterial extracellular solute-binding protein
LNRSQRPTDRFWSPQKKTASTSFAAGTFGCTLVYRTCRARPKEGSVNHPDTFAHRDLRPDARLQVIEGQRFRAFCEDRTTMDDFMPATVVGYSEWPKNTPNYWALPAMGDATGWTYRKDWFARPEIQADFKKKYNHELAPPETWDQLKEIAEFFQGREIDGKKVFSAYIDAERGSEGTTVGVTNHHDYRLMDSLHLSKTEKIRS